MIIGYARVSTVDQNLESQIQALTEAGCEKIFQDKISGKKADRPGLNEALGHLRVGDTLVVTKLDRLGRDLRDLVNHLHEFDRKGILFKSIIDSIDTTTATGKLHLSIIGAMAEFEHGLTSERIKFALSKARARGKPLGRQFAVKDADKQIFIDLFVNRNIKTSYIAKKFDISPACVYLTAKRFGLDDRMVRAEVIETRSEYLKTTEEEKL